MIKRDFYLDKLIRRKENGLIKVITGIRRCGKTYLLFNIFYQYLRQLGVEDDHIIRLSLEENKFANLRNPLLLDDYIRGKLVDKKMYYVFIDEIQYVADIPNPYLNDKNETIGFSDVVLGLMKLDNVDLYISGSNSRMLSSNLPTQFRGRGDEIRVRPLSYKEFYDSYNGQEKDAWINYCLYGGMPYLINYSNDEDKSNYLNRLFNDIYLRDVLEWHKMRNDKMIIEDVLDIVSSSIGSLTNPIKIANTLKSVNNINIAPKSISRYIDYLSDAFLINKARRYDVRGRRYIDSPFKYYFEDVGLRNVRINFRQNEENHIMENIIYNELLLRGFNVDIGIVSLSETNKNGISQRKQLEVDFVANKGNERYYIQSAFMIPDEEKRRQEIRPYKLIDDSFKKIVIVKDDMIPRYDQEGIFFTGIERFLLNPDILQSK